MKICKINNTDVNNCCKKITPQCKLFQKKTVRGSTSYNNNINNNKIYLLEKEVNIIIGNIITT